MKKEIELFKRRLSILSSDLTLYDKLYGCQESIDQLNKFNNLVFASMQRAFIRSLFLQFATIFDPAGSGKRTNLSLEHIINITSLTDDNEVSKDHGDLKKRYKATNIKNFRDKLLAHADKSAYMEKIKVGTSTTPKKLLEILEGVLNIINLIQYKVDDEVPCLAASDGIMTLPYDKNGAAFLRKLGTCKEQ